MTTFQIRRIVVAVDASEDSLAALEASAALARTLGVELVGVYVEDPRVAALAEVPFLQEIDPFSGEARPLRADALRRQLRLHARRAREALGRVAGRLEVRWTFQTVRGRPDSELLTLATETDLVTVGIRSRSPGRGPGSTVRALLSRAERPFLVVCQGPREGGSVVAVHDGSPVGDRAVGVAAGLRKAGAGESLVVLVVREAVPGEGSGDRGRRPEGGRAEPEGAPGGEDAARTVADRLSRELEEVGVKARFRVVSEGEPRRLARILRAEGAGFLVVPRPYLREGEGLQVLLRGSNCPVLVVG